ncbi:hypothetical protein M433DRAFT_338902 [Acidomyces richmondensis BFW]|nr:MAG: hypothetical protein FE78DRAFT_508157 [Acidomyces sp. 'richmondensis']KYG49203.1 hypothetical protein M433DRAFT_338902 [Acidomyces richmondensis BFW]
MPTTTPSSNNLTTHKTGSATAPPIKLSPAPPSARKIFPTTSLTSPPKSPPLSSSASTPNSYPPRTFSGSTTRKPYPRSGTFSSLSPPAGT